MKKILFLIFIFTLLFLSGCSSIEDIKNSGLNSNSNSNSNNENNLNNNKGIEIDFDKNTFETDYFTNEKYSSNLIFKNYMENDTNVYFQFIGDIGKVYQVGLYNKKNLKINSASNQISPKTKIFTYKNFYFKNINSKIQTKLNLKFCYKANTFFQQPITIKSKNQFDLDPKYLNGPLNINVKDFIKSGKKARVIFSIKNINNGKIVKDCFTKNPSGDYEFNFHIADKKLDCKKIGSDKFYNNEYDDNIISCSFDIQQNNEEVKLILKGNLKYTYEDTTSKNINIHGNLE